MAEVSTLLIWQKIKSASEVVDVAEALRCEIHDPLWMLGRQWQMGEFKGEDAGTAAFANIVSESTAVSQILGPENTAAVRYNHLSTPLNTAVESIPMAFTLNIRLEAAKKWKSMLLAAGKENAWKSFLLQPILHFKLPLAEYEPENELLLAAENESFELLLTALSNGRMIDGLLLYRELQNRKASDFLIQPDAVVNETGILWKSWLEALLGFSGAKALYCWDAERLEYRADSSVDLKDNGQAYLKLPEYNGKLMDNYNWEETIKSEKLQSGGQPSIQVHSHSFIPTTVSFPGMPSSRWWEFEDNTINFGNLKADKSDLGLLLLAEFGLIFSNDWLITPLSIPMGHLARAREIAVTDVFGVQSHINAVKQDKNWELFQSTTNLAGNTKGWIYFPPVASQVLESEKIEEVHFIRDEMANLVWAIEKTIANGTGETTDGENAAIKIENMLKALSGETIPSVAPVNENDDFRYLIANTVPPNWIPFIPVRNKNIPDAQIVFRRGAMPRISAEFGNSRIRPRTSILQEGIREKKRYDILEEEIPASGLIVSQLFRRTRWADGKTITWMAREKTVGRHTISSGLQFDQLI